MSLYKALPRSKPSQVLADRLASSCAACSRRDLTTVAFFSPSRPAIASPPAASTSQLRLDSREHSARLLSALGRTRTLSGEARAVEAEEYDEEKELEADRTELGGILGELEIEHEAKAGLADVQDRTTPPAPTPRPAPLTLQTFLRPPTPSGMPTIQDLVALRPRRVQVADPNSTPSRRMMYEKSHGIAYSNLSRAFNKLQLRYIVGPKEAGGLGLDTLDPRHRASIKGKSKNQKWWAPKRLDQMSKRELISLVLVLHWDMPDPSMIPQAKVGPIVTERVPLSDRTTFLLLSPNSKIMPTLPRKYGVKLSFDRDPKTSVLSLIVKGSQTGVMSAKDDLEGITNTCDQRDLPLPLPASSLRPEVYQAVSRMSKAYLEPGSTPTTLTATAVGTSSVERTKHLLGIAFAHNAIQSITPVFASISADFDSIKYGMYPFSASPTPPWTAGATTNFSRVRTVSLAPIVGSAFPDSEHAAALEFVKWSEKSGMDSARYVSLASKGMTKVLPSLRAPFKALEVEGEQLTLKGTFGHVVWPLYVKNGPTGQALEPVLDGAWEFSKFLTWSQRQSPKLKSVFLPSSPSGFLASTGVLAPLSEASPFAALLAPVDLEAAALTGPTIDAEDFQRLVYRPVRLPREGDAVVSIEIRIEEDLSSSRRLVTKSAVDVLVPNGACDLELSMEHVKELESTELSPFAVTQDARPPASLTYESQVYLLDTHRSIRRTTVTPRTPFVTSATQYTHVQEHWHDVSTPDLRGTSVETLMGRNEGEWVDQFQAGLTAMEKAARVPFPSLGDASRDRKIFGRM